MSYDREAIRRQLLDMGATEALPWVFVFPDGVKAYLWPHGVAVSVNNSLWALSPATTDDFNLFVKVAREEAAKQSAKENNQ